MHLPTQGELEVLILIVSTLLCHFHWLATLWSLYYAMFLVQRKLLGSKSPAGKALPPDGSRLTTPQPARVGNEMGVSFFSSTTAIRDVRYLLDHTYVTFGETVYKQTQGDQMGTNPAVHIANLFLFHDENVFIKQLAKSAKLAAVDLAVGATASRAAEYFTNPTMCFHYKPWEAIHVLRSMQSNTRYVDDIITFATPTCTTSSCTPVLIGWDSKEFTPWNSPSHRQI